MKAANRLIFTVAASLLLCSMALATETSLFDIRHRPAQDLLPQVRALLGKDGAVSAYGSRLIVRAPADRLEEVRWLIAELDRAPRNLLVEVRADREKSHIDRAADVNLRDMQANVRIRRHSTRGGDDMVQRVRTIDGRPALIRIGQSVPIYQMEQSREGDRTTQHLEVEYKDIHTGIHVLPRTHGENVTVEVYQQAESPALATGHFNTQHADTVVSGRLGEWIPLGSIDTSGRSRGTGLGYRASTGLVARRYLSVRVSAIR